MSDLAIPPSAVVRADIASRALLDQIDDVIERAVLSSNPQLAVSFGNSLTLEMQMRGVALAKFLFKFRGAWENQFASIGIAEERFEDMIEAQMGLSVQTTRKYSEAWRAIFENETIPLEVRNRLMGKPIKSLLSLTAAAKDGDLTAEEWEVMANAVDETEIRDLVRKKRGEQTSSKTSLTIYMTESGTLKAKQGEVTVTLGFLNIKEMKDEPVMERAIERLIERGNILWQ